MLFIIGTERHAPDRLARHVARRRKLGRDIVIIGEDAGAGIAERNQHRTGQRCQVDDQLRIETALRVPEHITENEATFRIGIEDLNRLTRHGGDDIARTLGIAVRHVLDQADNTDGIDLRLAARQGAHQADHGSGTAHIALHFVHAGTRLERDTATVKGQALADE